MPKTQYLTQRRKTWYVRLRVPQDLVGHYKSKEIQRSLKTRNFDEARMRLSPVKAEIEADFIKIRKGMQAEQGQEDALSLYSDEEMLQMTRAWLTKVQQANRQRRIKSDGNWSEQRKKDYLIELEQDAMTAKEEALGMSGADRHEGMTTAGHFLQEQGIAFDPKSDAFRKLGHFFSEAIYDLARRHLAEVEGKASLNTQPVKADAPPNVNPIRIKQFIEKYFADPSFARGESTRKNYIVVLRALDEVVGHDSFVHEIDRDACKASLGGSFIFSKERQICV